MLEALASAVEGTPFALWAARNPLAYPIANVVHVLGLALLLGGIAIVDLRVLGAWPRLPLPPLMAALVPVAIAGLLLQIVSGAVLFAADARSLAGSDPFQWKLVLIALATANALLFRRLWRQQSEPPAALRAMALASVLLWTSVAVLGRWIAYA